MSYYSAEYKCRRCGKVFHMAYIVVFGALKEHDERQKEEAKRKK